jgi:glutamine---fructose-6-phosphate transaminase (isomerizing)
MCGIVGAIAQRDVADILLQGINRLEYRGYDSAGMAVLEKTTIDRQRTQGKVAMLADALKKHPLPGHLGIAHTRWATHGKPSERNAHPQMSGNDIALVHNGIIENFEPLRKELIQQGYTFHSETDTEVIAHLIHRHLSQKADFMEAVKKTVSLLKGAYALAIIHKDYPDQLIGVRQGSPLVIGLGNGENFLSSDTLALLSVTQKFMYLEEGDFVLLTREAVSVFDASHQPVTRPEHISALAADATKRGRYRHYMQKEIYEQKNVLADVLEGRLSKNAVIPESFGSQATSIFKDIQQIQIIACGTSYHAGLVARYWLESIAHVPCNVDVASEYRYRQPAVPNNTLVITISQSGETADTLAALRATQKNPAYCASLAICNVPESSLVRESDMVFMTRAGTEIGVASTKAFTTQLTALLMLTLSIAKMKKIAVPDEAVIIKALKHMPRTIREIFSLEDPIKDVAQRISTKNHALFLGRGTLFPIALEGALKLKEISYIHAEGYPAGELKHGPLALVDKNMPVIAIGQNDDLLEKLKSNLQEVRARDGELFIFANEQSGLTEEENVHVIHLPHVHDLLAPIVYTIPLQLLAYHTAVIKGTDIDKPRNLAKSVTVE